MCVHVVFPCGFRALTIAELQAKCGGVVMRNYASEHECLCNVNIPETAKKWGFVYDCDGVDVYFRDSQN